jgi:hypothetical protein
MNKKNLEKEKESLKKRLEMLDQEEETLRLEYLKAFRRLQEIEVEELGWISEPAR